ncbi:ADP-ribosylglycohydrolase family protein [Streptomyces sp. RKND-216]|uniref:ADP-ribosylglycohydrolase family protein n=1 Tax=Streptomyces sp. RKND-216 TaxID=2562581 RepID=UPI00109DF94C|nr:ADP-ribosylglycohydrolase family protein [Streptomyces sp. RKND-216]THA24150.1 ADP-ribosylglycohydrolase family protein [Streptomyces sp. RKND-216]
MTTDDTEMACSVLHVLAEHGEIDQDALAAAFATHHDFDRGYGPAVNRMLRPIRQEDADWRRLSSELFDGQGSWGNGAAMRVAPLGAWFANAPERAAEQAELSAVVTHRHPEAVVGAIAVAVAAARHLGAFEEALWNTLRAGGDVDTAGAIVGGVVVVSAGGAPPQPWTRRTEVLLSWMPALVRGL